MAHSLMDLKKSRKANFDKLADQLNKQANKEKFEGSDDDRFWSPTVDKEGNGFAVIRFMPEPIGEDFPYVRYWDHGFQGPTNKWYIENSLTTFGKDSRDPVSTFNSELWNKSDNDESPERKQARRQKRRLHFIANIQVVQDASKPENNGKVKLFKFGKKIFDKLNDKMNPSDKFEVIEPINPFDAWEGLKFNLRIRTVDRTSTNPKGYRSYDKSDFDANKTPIAANDEAIEEMWRLCQPLQPFVDRTNKKLWKSYEELEKRFNEVMGLDGSDASKRLRAAEEQARKPVDERPSEEPAPATRTKPAPKAPEAKAGGAPADDEIDENYFKRLIDDDIPF